jgi:ankyrin repeat protein|tara:strand:+ start:281 stop:697 length:417 start_codon:yes stop_codon:yes gene_type:complete
LKKDLIYTKFWNACIHDDVISLLDVIEHVQEIDKKNHLGWSGIIMAAFNHSFSVIPILLKYKSNINDANANGTSVFMYAKTKCVNKNFKILSYLLKNGADINLRDNKKGWTVLDYVYKSGNISLMLFIKKNGGKFSYE